MTSTDLLPTNFSSDMNDLVASLRDYEVCANDEEKDKILRKALVIACHMLQSLDLNALSTRINQIFLEVQIYEKTAIRNQTWSEAMFGSAGHFDYFLKNVEDGILRAVGVEDKNRARILQELRSLRNTALTEVGRATTANIVQSIQQLRESVCKMKDEQITAAQRRVARTRVVKTMLVGAIAANAVGSVVFPAASPAALAASVTLGGVAQYIPEIG